MSLRFRRINANVQPPQIRNNRAWIALKRLGVKSLELEKCCVWQDLRILTKYWNHTFISEKELDHKCIRLLAYAHLF